MSGNTVYISAEEGRRMYADLLRGTPFTCAQDIRERQYRGIWAPEEDDLLWQLEGLEGTSGIPDSRVWD